MNKLSFYLCISNAIAELTTSPKVTEMAKQTLHLV